jgi:ABC-type amino acid transport substrate-binding protein
MRANWIASCLFFLSFLVAGPAAAQGGSIDDQLKAANLAPTGVLRVAFLGTNPIQARVDPATGEVIGPVADIVAELASRIGVPHEFQPVDGAGNVIAAVNSGAADLGFLAYEAARAEQVDFAGPYATMTSSYLVAANSPLQSSADVDAEGNIIGTVVARSQQIFLSGNIQHAEVLVWDAQPSDEDIERMLVSGEISAVGQNRQRSVDYAAEFPTLRVIDDAFMAVPQAFVMTPNQPEKADALNRFMDELRGNGFVQASLERAELQNGASVAPPGIP